MVMCDKISFCFMFLGTLEDMTEAHGEYMGIQVSMDYHVLRRLDLVSRIRLSISCKGKHADVRATHCFIFESRGNNIIVVPALRNFDIEKMEFDEGYMNIVFMQTGLRPSFQKPIPSFLNFSAFAHPVTSQKCQRCSNNLTTTMIKVPECTWLMIVEFPDSLKKAPLRSLEMVTEVRVGAVVFKLGWVSLLESTNHLISIHHFDNRWYFFDDLYGARMVRIQPREFELGSREYLHAFYYRETERNPHRCLKRIVSDGATWDV